MAKKKNHGKPWKPADNAALRKLAKQNTPTGLIAHKLGRTEGAAYPHASEKNVSLKPTNRSSYNPARSRNCGFGVVLPHAGPLFHPTFESSEGFTMRRRKRCTGLLWMITVPMSSLRAHLCQIHGHAEDALVKSQNVWRRGPAHAAVDEMRLGATIYACPLAKACCRNHTSPTQKRAFEHCLLHNGLRAGVDDPLSLLSVLIPERHESPGHVLSDLMLAHLVDNRHVLARADIVAGFEDQDRMGNAVALKERVNDREGITTTI